MTVFKLTTGHHKIIELFKLEQKMGVTPHSVTHLLQDSLHPLTLNPETSGRFFSSHLCIFVLLNMNYFVF